MLEVRDFYPNPGELRMLLHLPPEPMNAHSLVIAMHGCTQNAHIHAKESGWNQLADKHGFIVLYPEQRTENNPNRCFNWFRPEHIARDKGETMSIKAMTDYVKETYGLDHNRMFVSGISAGACMTVAMLAAYPELFQAGGIHAGLPYKAGLNERTARQAMRGEIHKSKDQWAHLVREENPSYLGEYPKLVIFHGEKDKIVSLKNVRELVEQWGELHKIEKMYPQIDVAFDNNPKVTRTSYMGTQEDPAIVVYTISELGHGLSVHPGTGPKEGGCTGTYAFDTHFHASFWMSHFFGLLSSPIH